MRPSRTARVLEPAKRRRVAAASRGPGPARLVVGLMSGTSADGIDAVLARLQGTGRGLRARLVRHVHRPFSPALRREILRVCLHGKVNEICELNFALGEQFADAVEAVLASSGTRPENVWAVGSHGQTIHHLPGARHPSTLQIGEPAVIAERTGILTVANFRVRDMAAGGQGAPLVPYADWALLADERKPRVIQNIGGIGNVTFLPPDPRLDEVIAFDTGPGNMVIDAVVAHLSGGRLSYDRGGRWAAKGRAHAGLLARLLRHPFFLQHPPKTTGREQFGERFVRELRTESAKRRLSEADVVATATALTAHSIARAYADFIKPRLARSEAVGVVEVVLGGGGARNATLRQMLQSELGRHFTACEVLTHEYFGIPDAAKEALAFAILAHETLQGVPANVPSATGARRAVVLGNITPAPSRGPRSSPSPRRPGN